MYSRIPRQPPRPTGEPSYRRAGGCGAGMPIHIPPNYSGTVFSGDVPEPVEDGREADLPDGVLPEPGRAEPGLTEPGRVTPDDDPEACFAGLPRISSLSGTKPPPVLPSDCRDRRPDDRTPNRSPDYPTAPTMDRTLFRSRETPDDFTRDAAPDMDLPPYDRGRGDGADGEPDTEDRQQADRQDADRQNMDDPDMNRQEPDRQKREDRPESQEATKATVLSPASGGSSALGGQPALGGMLPFLDPTHFPFGHGLGFEELLLLGLILMILNEDEGGGQGNDTMETVLLLGLLLLCG